MAKQLIIPEEDRLPEREPRVLLWDIETAPVLGYIWQPWEANMLWKVKDWYLLSVAWKWLGDDEVQVASLDQYDYYAKDPQDDYPLVYLAYDLFDEADVVVAHNGVSFDTKKANARIIIHDIGQPSPFKEVDTLQLARKNFAFTKNNLDEVCRDLGIGEKIQTGGIDLWRDIVENDDPEAWELMRMYNQHDVEILEALYLRLRGWDKKHPNMATITNRPDSCIVCLGNRFQRRGFAHTAVSYRIRYQCLDCGKYQSGRKIYKTDTKHVN